MEYAIDGIRCQAERGRVARHKLGTLETVTLEAQDLLEVGRGGALRLEECLEGTVCPLEGLQPLDSQEASLIAFAEPSGPFEKDRIQKGRGRLDRCAS